MQVFSPELALSITNHILLPFQFNNFILNKKALHHLELLDINMLRLGLEIHMPYVTLRASVEGRAIVL